MSHFTRLKTKLADLPVSRRTLFDSIMNRVLVRSVGNVGGDILHCALALSNIDCRTGRTPAGTYSTAPTQGRQADYVLTRRMLRDESRSTERQMPVNPGVPVPSIRPTPGTTDS